MNPDLMNLKILLPYKVLSEVTRVRRIVAETTQGSMGLLSHRLDCVAILTPGILTYQGEEGGDIYIAVDAGILIKVGLNISVSVRDAVTGTGLEQLRQDVKEKFVHLDDQEKQARAALVKMEGGLVHRIWEINHER